MQGRQLPGLSGKVANGPPLRFCYEKNLEILHEDLSLETLFFKCLWFMTRMIISVFIKSFCLGDIFINMFS